MDKSNRLLEKLEPILLVPDKPIDTDTDTLEQNQQKMNVSFPEDYLEFSTLYGSGHFSADGRGIEFYSVGRVSYPDIVQDFFERQNEYREAMETYNVPLGLFPESGGLLPFAKDDSGIYYCWDTHGVPSSWTVVVIWEYEEEGFKRHNSRFIDFLHGLLTGNEIHQLWGEKWKPSLPINYESKVYSV